MIGSEDTVIKIWDYKTGVYTLDGHTEKVNSVIHIPDTKYIVSGSWDRKIKIWNYEIRECFKTLEGHEDNVTSLAYIPNT